MSTNVNDLELEQLELRIHESIWSMERTILDQHEMLMRLDESCRHLTMRIYELEAWLTEQQSNNRSDSPCESRVESRFS